MSILSGYGKFKRYVLTDNGYKLCSQWTSSNTVHFDDGKTAQTKVGAINGITDSLTATNSNIALSAAAGKNLQDQVTQLNTGMNEVVPQNVQAYVAEHKSELQGPKGDKGDKGDKGNTGATGPQGPSGSPWGGGTFTGTTNFTNTIKIGDGISLCLGPWSLRSASTQKLFLYPQESIFGLFYGVTDDLFWSFCPASDNSGLQHLGSPTHRWGQLYCTTSTISTSDRNLKKDITPISDKYLDFFALLQPVTYRFKDGSSERIHVGFISQDVETAMAEAGLTDLDFAGFCKDKAQREIRIPRKEQVVDENGTPVYKEYEDISYEDILDEDGNPVYIYALRYEEFIALNTAVIQRQQAKINSMEQRLEELEKKIATLSV